MNRDSNIPSAATIDSLKFSNSMLYHQLKKAAEDLVHNTIDTEIAPQGNVSGFPIPKRQAIGATIGNPSPAYMAPMPHLMMENNRPMLTPGVEVRGFIGERMCVISLQRGEVLKSRLQSYIQQAPLDPLQASSVKKTHARLHSMLDGVNVPPPLPAMIFGMK